MKKLIIPLHSLFMKFSGSSGIRMKWGEELVDLARDMARGIASRYDDVVIAGDFRRTSEAIMHIMIGELLASGASVSHGGHAPTPSLAYATRNHDVGIMITASHNPPEYNGIKLWNPDGSAFSDEQISEMSRVDVANWNEVSNLSEENIVEGHLQAVLERVGETNVKIVLDCANGAGSVITPFLLKSMGAEVITLNCQPSGNFPGHPSEPTEKNLTMLKKMVVREKADIGMAHDGDADRLIAISPDGHYLNGDIILALFAKFHGFRRIVAPVDSSMLLEKFAEVTRCRVGDANVSQVMRERGIEFGGEQSGTQIFADWRYTPDAIYSAAQLAEISSRMSITDFLNELPEYYTFRRSIYYENREEMEQKIEKLTEDYECSTIDGYRCLADGGWFLIRFSGTEPKVRVTVEAAENKKAKEIMERINNILKS